MATGTTCAGSRPAVLVQLERIDVEELRALIVDAWLCRAPRRLAQAYLDDDPR